MRALKTTLISALLLLALAPRPAQAATSCGTIVTNAAMITMWSGPIDQIGYELSYCVTATVMVICPITAVNKYAKPQIVASGGIVTFYICIDNQRMSADGSVWNVTVTDRLPYGMAFDANSMVAYNYGVGALNPASDISWATSLAGPWTFGNPAGNTASPLYLRWRIPTIGVLKSGCVAYRATVQ